MTASTGSLPYVQPTALHSTGRAPIIATATTVEQRHHYQLMERTGPSPARVQIASLDRRPWEVGASTAPQRTPQLLRPVSSYMIYQPVDDFARLHGTDGEGEQVTVRLQPRPGLMCQGELTDQCELSAVAVPPQPLRIIQTSDGGVSAHWPNEVR
jgi:hypothetical protein